MQDACIPEDLMKVMKTLPPPFEQETYQRKTEAREDRGERAA